MNDPQPATPAEQDDDRVDLGAATSERATTADPQVGQPQRRGFLARLIAPVDLGAAAVALVFWFESLRPSLLPRPASSQGVVSALALLVGYGIGGLALLAFRAQRERTGWFTPTAEQRRIGRLVLAVATGLAVVVGSLLWFRWQNDQRTLVTMPAIEPAAVATAAVVTAVVAVVVFALARVIGFVVGRIDGWLGRRLHPVAAHAIVAAALVLLVVGITNRVVIDGLIGSVDATFAEGDRTSEPGVVQPTIELRTGGPGSLVAWDTLGRQGRSFVAGATTTEQLAAFAGPGEPVDAPIRVYAGLESAPDAEARADLAVDELERTGAFDREALLVVTVTGTGWINPVAAAAFEYVGHGDTAIVGMQYSYLPSWISTLVDQDKATEAGRALEGAVYERWSQLPADARPRLIVYGESLGSFGSEGGYVGPTAADSVDAATSRSDGVLWVAPTNSNPVWSQVVAARQPDSPVWRPVYGDGREVVFVNDPAQLTGVTPEGPPTVVYPQHASDPVTWWNPSILWAPPEWTREPKGPDVPSQVSWFPVVTWLQVTFDLIEGFNTPPGHGHNFNDVFAAGFAALAAPPGWTADDTARLEPILATVAEGEQSL